MNKHEIIGKKFEKWMEALLRANDYSLVRRNIEYHRSRYQLRQVDLEYFSFLSLSQSFVILELKYTTNGLVRLKRRNGATNKSGQLIKHIDDIVTEHEERRRFVKADTAILVTNGQFEEAVHDIAARYGIELWERGKLLELQRKRRGLLGYVFPPRTDINTQIRQTKGYNTPPIIEDI